MAALALGVGLGLALLAPAPQAIAQVYYRDAVTGQWVYDANPYKPRKAKTKRNRLASGPVDIQRSCRRQVRRSVGAIPGVRMRMPRSYPQLIDRCIANGGVYS
jgi:hypothetical protein